VQQVAGSEHQRIGILAFACQESHRVIAASTAAAPKLTFTQQVRSFAPAFWVANVIELIERFSFWGIRTIAALYILAPLKEGGLGLSNTDKGIFFGVWSGIQCFLPMFTGGFADRYGYRASLLVAFGINIVGYAAMGFTHSWWSFMAACCLIGTGTAIFKPPLHGTLAHCVDASNSSVGWGLFYQVVNIGGFVGPMVMGYLRLLEWRYAFFVASAVVLLNVLVMSVFLEDYSKKNRPDAPARPKGPAAVLAEAFTTLRDLRFVVFLAIFSGFFFMFMQLSDQVVVFLDQWVERRTVGKFLTETLGLRFLVDNFTKGGGVNAEWIQDVDALAIIFLMPLIGYLTGLFRHISAMIVGMFICCVAFGYLGNVTAGWLSVLGIFVFAVGEMICSPKMQEYVGLMAPPEKKALYMGYSNLPFAFGWTGANFIGGPLYEHLSDKHNLAREYLVTRLGQTAEAVTALPKEEIMPRLAALLGTDEAGAQHRLWTTYHPQMFFYICTAIGLLATLAMVGYHFWLKSDAQKRTAATAQP
jgi:POT family proton-dependent oligopeptide transporter